MNRKDNNSKSPAASSIANNNNNTNNIILMKGGVQPTSSMTTNNRFLAFPADISLVSEEKKIFKVAKEAEEFSNMSEKEKTRIKLERGAASLTVESVSGDIRRKRNAAAARLRREMLQREGIISPHNNNNNTQKDSSDGVLEEEEDHHHYHTSTTNPEFKEKIDEAVINSMNFPLHCDDDEPIAWKGPPIEFLEQPDDLTKAEREAQDRAMKQQNLNQNGKYWMSVYATNSKKPNPKMTMIQRQLLHQQEQNERKPGILTGRSLPFEIGEAEFIARKNAKTEASIKKQIEEAILNGDIQNNYEDALEYLNKIKEKATCTRKRTATKS